MKRDTAQRRAIRSAIEEAGRPLSPTEILEGAKRRCPGVGIATVYRTLKVLVGERCIDPVELPGSPPRYELCRSSHHHHFVCRGCDRVYEVEGCLHALIGSLTPPGFHLEDHDMTLYGRCSECARAS